MITHMRKRVPYRLAVLTPGQVETIHKATLDVLWETGAYFEDPVSIQLLRCAGATCDEGGRIRIPPELVNRAIATAPSTMVMYGREGQEAMRLEPEYVYCGTGSDCPNVLDLESGQRRPAVKRDTEMLTRLADALPNIDFVLSNALATDVPAQEADIHHFQAMVCNTTKPIFFTAVDHGNLTCIIDLATEIAGGAEALAKHPFIAHFAMPSPPLRHSRTALQNLVYCARHSIPVVYASGTTMGGTGPMSIAGGTVSSNCDVLGGLVVHQLANPGAPFIYGCGVSLMDMRTSIDAYGAPEHYLGDIVNSQVAQSYNLPTWGYAANSDSKALDQQAAIEFFGCTLTGLLSQSSLLHDVGYLESGLTTSAESLVLGDEVIAFARRILQEVTVDEESLALDTIKRVGFTGTFLAERHTVKHVRDFWYSPLIDRRRYDAWASDGQQTMLARVRARARDILSSHQPTPLPESLMSHLTACVTRACRGV